jgi:hypothetical protein
MGGRSKYSHKNHAYTFKKSCYNEVHVLVDYKVTGWWENREQELVVRVATATKLVPTQQLKKRIRAAC